MHSISQVETYLSDYLANTEHKKTALINELLDYAASNLAIGVQLVHDAEKNDPTPDQVDSLVFIYDTVRAIRLAKTIQQSGHLTGDYLKQIETEMGIFRDDLLFKESKLSYILADYVSVAMQEVNVARYVEENYLAGHHDHVYGHGYGYGYTSWPGHGYGFSNG